MSKPDEKRQIMGITVHVDGGPDEHIDCSADNRKRQQALLFYTFVEHGDTHTACRSSAGEEAIANFIGGFLRRYPEYTQGVLEILGAKVVVLPPDGAHNFPPTVGNA